jgi:hypothetical protein
MSSLRRRIAALSFALAFSSAPGGAQEAGLAERSPALYWRVKLSVGYHYSIGDYGLSDATQINYVPLIGTVDIDRWRLQLTIPYLHISGPPGIITGPDGNPIQTTDGTSDGLGDVLARASYLVPVRRLLPESWAMQPWVPLVALIGLVKFPTASRSQGLGTGEFDLGIEGELSWVLGDLMPFASVGYRFLGSPPGTHLDNVLIAVGGAQYRVLPMLSAGLLLDYRQAPTAVTGERLELVPYASWLVVPPWTLDGYVSAGLAKGSPAVGVGIQAAYTW